MIRQAALGLKPNLPINAVARWPDHSDSTA